MEVSDDMVMAISPGFVRTINDWPVTRGISADVAMRYTQIYDELPLLLQTLCKLLAIATRGGFFKLPFVILWEVQNDLIDEDVEKDILETVVQEMKEMWLLKIDMEDGKKDSRVPMLCH